MNDEKPQAPTISSTGEAPAEVKAAGPPKSTLREYFESFVVTLIMAIFGMTFILQAVTVPTGSMQNTILIGDYLLVNKFIFTPGGHELPFLPQREIKRGDIIVFKYPGNKLHPKADEAHGSSAIPYQVNYVKRVIGLPGETVEFRDNHVYVNGELLPENRMLGDPPTKGDQESALITSSFEDPTASAEWTVYYSKETIDAIKAGQRPSHLGYEFCVPGKPNVVPPNSFFVMGDSRDNSEDSRYWGFVPRDLIIGRAMFVYWSCDRGASGGSALGCITHPRFNRIGHFVK
ncbi:MAG: signal peptidase I [Acidobacteria bacterium]|nr:signal peptidase I [Acidobacteriota bacterium]